MKRVLVSLVVAAVAAVGFGGVSALASSGKATPFKAQYPGLPNSTWSCAGAHVANRISVKDSETCSVTGDTSGYVSGVFTSGQICPPGNPPSIVGTPACGQFPPFSTPDQPVYWASDFNGNLAISWSISLTANPDGTLTGTIVSYYSS